MASPNRRPARLRSSGLLQTLCCEILGLAVCCLEIFCLEISFWEILFHDIGWCIITYVLIVLAGYLILDTFDRVSKQTI
jgi:hypothetical protein